MENPLINSPHNLIDFPLKPHHHHPISALTPNGGGGDDDDDDEDIEMIAFHGMAYTSLKDLLPASPPASISPTSGSWREIPIKDPLVQHAAWAYLQPMAEARGEDERWWWRRLEKKCCGLLSCFNDVVLVVFRGWGSDDDDDDGDGKVG